MKVSSLIKATLCAICILSVVGCVSEPQSHEKPRIFTIDKEYGTLRFRGTVTRADIGTEYEYELDVSATFLPDAPYNRVSAINLTHSDLQATIYRGEGAGVGALQTSRQSLTFHLGDANETKKLPPLSFRLSKHSVAHAYMVVLGVGDGHLWWPMSLGLK